jgi:hypothetical protein
MTPKDSLEIIGDMWDDVESSKLGPEYEEWLDKVEEDENVVDSS